MKSFFKFGSPVIEELGLDQIGISDYLTASGEEKLTNVYKADIKLFDEEIEVPVLSTDAHFSLAGMELFDECRIIIERLKGIVEVSKSV